MKDEPLPTPEKIRLPCLGILRAAKEGKSLGHYFGSLLSLNYWIQESVTLGLIDEAGAPTILGKYLYSALDLGSISGQIRAYMWPSDLQTTAAAALAAQRMANMVETGDA